MNLTEGFRFDLESQLTGQPQSTQEPQLVLPEAVIRRTHGTNQFALQIFLSLDVVDDLLIVRIQKKRIDGEVTTQDIVLGVREFNRSGVPTVFVL